MRGIRRAIVALCLGLEGCVSIPDATSLAIRPDGKPPLIEDSGHMRPWGETEAKRLARFPGDDEALQKQVAAEGRSAGTPLVAGNSVRLLVNGPATYAAMRRAILSARHTIDLEIFTLEDDVVGREIAGLLAAESRSGVAVQIIYDADGSIDTPASFWDRLRAAGVRVLEYNPLDPLKARTGYHPNHRDHCKLLVVDGRTAITGGINITDVYIYGGVESGASDRWWLHWRDTDVEIDGPVVAELQRTFLTTWRDHEGAPLPDRRFFPPLAATGKAYVRAVPGTPAKGDLQIYVALISAIRHAARHVWITTAYFDPTPEEIDALKAASRRGVDVELVVQGQTDSQATLAAGRSHYAELLAAGVEIFERWDVFLHGKTATIDDVWSIVGSDNFDARSVIWNNELAAIVLGHDFAREMDRMFVADRARGTPITAARWAERPIGERIAEWSARLVEGLL